MRVKWFVTSAILAALAVAPGYAQTTPALRVTVPFEFTINNTVMPAGQYSISDGGIPGISLLAMRSSDYQHTVVFTANEAVSSNPPVQSTLVFNRYGSKYFLSAISWATYNTGVQLPRSETEKEFAKTASLRRPEQLVLMASR